MELAITNDRRMLVIILGMLTMLGPLSIDLYLPALPAIANGMGESLSAIQLTLSAYTIGFAVGQLIYGPLSDRFGRQAILLPGLGAFILCSALAAFCTTAHQLIVVRIFQAMAASAILVTVPSMIRDSFPREESAKTLSLVYLVMMVAPLIAPVLGGQLLKFWGWQALFYFIAIMAIAALLMVFFQLNETLPTSKRSSFLSVKTVLANYQSVLKHREAMGYILSHSFICGGLFAFIAGSPAIYIEIYQIKPETYGFLFALNVIAMTIMNMVNIKMIGRVHLFILLKVGCIIATVSAFILLINTSNSIGGLIGIVLPVMLFMSSVSLTGANANALALAHFPNVAGAANAIAGSIVFLMGGISTIAVSYFDEKPALAMSIVMFICGCLSLASLLFTKNKGYIDDKRLDYE